MPQIVNGKSRFCPPQSIARDDAYCLFLDELNACSHEVQKAFYSLIHDRRLVGYSLPASSIVIGAGNRAQDSAIVKPMSSALLNRMVHVHLQASHRDWLEWAHVNGIHPLIIEYIQTRPDHLKVHWCLDVAFDEDGSRVRKDHAAHNLAVLCRLCLNLMRQEQNHKTGLKNRRLRAAWNCDYLLRLLCANNS